MNIKQTLYRCGIATWQEAKRKVPVLNNYSYIVGRAASRIFPPEGEEILVTVPWSDRRFLVPANSPSARTYAAQRYELEVVARMMELDLEGTTVVDIGAHVGYYTILLEELVGSNGIVFAFEPNPISFNYLHRNVDITTVSRRSDMRRNKSGASLFSFPLAVGETETSGFLEDIEKVEHGIIKESGTFRVQVHPLDSFSLSNVKRLGLIKIDTEGHEVPVLKGAKEVLKKHPETSLVIEHQSLKVNDAYEGLSATLLGYGYSRYQVIERGSWHELADPFPFPKHNIVYNLYFPPRNSS